MNIEISARNAEDQIKAREIIKRCLPDNVFGSIWANCYNEGKWYMICNRRLSLGGGFKTYGIDPINNCLTR